MCGIVGTVITALTANLLKSISNRDIEALDAADDGIS